MRIPGGRIGDVGAELGKAERLFRQSLELNPKQVEARIRLGHVLGRRGRHQEAIVELRRATM
jgi:Flp pilus assembly protein TadD